MIKDPEMAEGYKAELDNSSTKKFNPIVDGSIKRESLIYFIPVVAGMLIQQLYNTVDAMIIGRIVGKAALASVGGSAATITSTVVFVFACLANGAGVKVSHHYGEDNPRALERDLHTAYAFSVIAGLAFTAAGIMTCPAILRLMNTPEEIMGDSVRYLKIYFAGIIPMLIYNMGSGIMRSTGDSKRPLYYLILGSVLNIALDLLFIAALGWGVIGAAAATVIAQAISAVCVSASLTRAYDKMKLQISHVRIYRETLAEHLKIGLPGAAQASIWGVTYILIQSGINRAGMDAVAAWAIYGKFDGAFWAIVSAFGITITTFAGQNYGSGRIDRAYYSVKVVMMYALASGVVIITVLLLFASPICGLFSDDATVIATGAMMFRFLFPWYVISIPLEMFNSALRGFGDVIIPTVFSFIGTVLLRTMWLLLIVPRHFSLRMVMAGYPIGWVVVFLVLSIYYYYRKNMYLSDRRH